MVSRIRPPLYRQAGLSLIELMVSLLIGLIATLVIMQVMSVFEGRKRTTSGNADAQTSGSIALYTLQSQIQTAGFGLPIFVSDVSGASTSSALTCAPAPYTLPAGGTVGLFPIEITEGTNDTIVLRRSLPRVATAANPNPTQVIAGAYVDLSKVTIGCEPDDVMLTNPCTWGSFNATTTGIVACLGNWTETAYRINNSNLEERNNNIGAWSVVMSNIVSMKAQYGISDNVKKTQNISWINPSALNMADRNKIRAVRIALVARNTQFEKTNVTTSSISTQIGSVNLSSLPDWQKYRYRTFEAIIPLRNIIWSAAGY